MVVFKPTVRIRRFTLALQRILDVLVELDGRTYLGQDITVSSINDGDEHKPGSRHYTDEAVDVRCHDLAGVDKQRFLTQIGRELDAKFSVLLEDEGTPNEHIHIQVRKGGTYP